MAAAELEGALVVPRKISLAVAIAVALQLAGAAVWVSTATSSARERIERLERDALRDATTIADMNGRTIRMEADLIWIKSTLQRQAGR